MQKILLFLAGIIFSSGAVAQCITNVDFNTWMQEGPPANGNWTVQDSGTQIYQSVNGNPTFFISPYELMNVHISGNFKTTETDDNDWLGFVFSYLAPFGSSDSFDCWLYDWRQGAKHGASSGMSLDRLYGYLPPSTYQSQFWDHINSPAFTCVENTFGGPGYVTGFNNHFDLYLTYSEAKIYVNDSLTFDWQTCYKVGYFGFYNYSQDDCYYSNFQYSLYVDFTAPPQICLGAVSPIVFIPECASNTANQYQTVIWDFGDGTTDSILNPTTINVNPMHTYTTAGTYTVTLLVVDNYGCSTSQSHTVVVEGPITLTPNLTEPPCNGGSNGTVSAAASGGNGNYTYLWNGTVQDSIYSGVPAGTYTVSVSDGICNATAEYTLNQPTPLSATTSSTNSSCGQNNGSVTINISGGTPPYQDVTWAGVAGYTRTGLGPGTYIANFVDANMCSAALQYTATVGSTPCGITSSASSVNVGCSGGNNGQATVNVTGTVGTATITWSNGETGATATNLTAGTYTYTYSDGDPAHTFTDSVTIYQPGAAMVAQLTTIGIDCPAATDGEATVSVISGGTPPYAYNWSYNTHNVPYDTGLAPGLITVTVTDSNGCTATATGNISGVSSFSTSVTTIIDSCYHSGTGVADLSVTGGSPPYTYYWSNYYTDSLNAHLIAGTYTVTVTDSRGCTVTASATITGPSSALFESDTVINVACYGQSTGSITAMVSGGTPPYVIVWDTPGITGYGASGLRADEYDFTVTDASNCTVIGGDSVLEPDSALMVTTTGTNPSCNGGNNGSIAFSITGGTPPYSYLGNIIPSTDTIMNLYAGDTVLVIIDSAGCPDSVSAVINSSSIDSVNITSNKQTICSDDSAQICAPEGYTAYLWNNGDTTACFYTNLAGNYYVTVTNSYGCTVESDQLPLAVFEVSPVTITISNDTLTAFFAVTYQWYYDGVLLPGDTSSVLVASSPGYYYVSISDTNGCVVVSNNIDVTGITNLQNALSLKIYPDPATDELNISYKLNTTANLQISLTDITGRRIETVLNELEPGGNYLQKVNIHKLASAVYILNFTSESGSTNLRFVKE